MFRSDLSLSLETATRGGSLALMRGEILLASSTGIADESHSVNLLSRIETLLKKASVTLRDVDIFATAAGPGSFTGLRIGLATMKAFASTFNRPCVGVPTLEAIAFSAGSSACTYALLPAGRGEVFVQVFLLGARASRPLSVPQGSPFPDEAGETPAVPKSVPVLVPVSEPEHIPPDVLLERITEASSIHWAGPGAHLYKDLIQRRAAELEIEFVEVLINGRTPSVSEGSCEKHQWTLAPNIDQLAEYVATLALQRANDGEEHNAENLRAIYVRPSDAEIKQRSEIRG